MSPIERRVGFLAGVAVGDENLDRAGHVADSGETRLAHDALKHDAPGDRYLHRALLENFVGVLAVGGGEIGRVVFAREVVGKRGALVAHRLQFRAALLDQFFAVLGVVCLRGDGRLLRVLGHELQVQVTGTCLEYTHETADERR
jgi:hypothetical protein